MRVRNLKAAIEDADRGCEWLWRSVPVCRQEQFWIVLVFEIDGITADSSPLKLF